MFFCLFCFLYLIQTDRLKNRELLLTTPLRAPLLVVRKSPPRNSRLHHTQFLMNIQRSNPINISRYGRSRHKSHDFDKLTCLRTTESHQSFSPNLGSPSPPETPASSHCISRIGDYLLLEPLEGDHVFRAAHLHSGDELVCKVSTPPPIIML